MSFCKTIEIRQRFDNMHDTAICRHVANIFNNRFMYCCGLAKFSMNFRYVSELLSNSDTSFPIYRTNRDAVDYLLKFARHFIKGGTSFDIVILRYTKFNEFVNEIDAMYDVPGLWQDYVDKFDINTKFTQHEVDFFRSLINGLASHLASKRRSR